MKRIRFLVFILLLMLALSACGHTGGGAGSIDPQSGAEMSETGGKNVLVESGTDAPEGSDTEPDSANSSASRQDSPSIPNPGGQKPSAGVKYTDGNLYVLTDDRHFIIKIDPSFKGHEVMYEGKLNEIIYKPVYRNGALYFSRESGKEPEKIYRLDVNTKKVSTVLSADQVPDFNKWTVIDNQIFIQSIKSGGMVTIWMCDLDGGNLRKTAAADVFGLGVPVTGSNGKVYMETTPPGGKEVTFHEMTVSGTGFRRLFTKQHHLCASFMIQCVQDGSIYYSADSVRNESTGAGTFKVKLDGSGQTRVIVDPWHYAAADGKAVYIPPNATSQGISRIDQNGQVTHNVALKGKTPMVLTNIYNGYLYAECDRKHYILSVPGLKEFAVADYSPPSPFAKYKHGMNVLSVPTKTAYKVGEGFDPTGFEHLVYNSAGGTLMPEDDKITFVTSDGVTLTRGRPFTAAGTKTVEIRYNGRKAVATYTVTVTADSGNLSAGLNILTYPIKTSYKIGEGFDTTGLNAVYYADGKETNVNDKITFFTSNTVELTQGRPFQTTGKKVVEIRYNGKKAATYTVTVTD